MSLFNYYNDFMNEEQFIIKRKYTELYPEKIIYSNIKLRNIILNAIADGEVTEDEMLKIIEKSGVSNTWFLNNKSFFKIVQDEGGYTKFRLTDKALKLWEKINKN